MDHTVVNGLDSFVEGAAYRMSMNSEDKPINLALPLIEWVDYRIPYERQRPIRPNIGHQEPLAGFQCRAGVIGRGSNSAC